MHKIFICECIALEIKINANDFVTCNENEILTLYVTNDSCLIEKKIETTQSLQVFNNFSEQDSVDLDSLCIVPFSV